MSVLNYLDSVASNAVIQPQEKQSIVTSITTLQTRLNSYFNNGELLAQFIFGSFTRETILPRKMDENSDIDYMVVFSDKSFKPQTYLDKLKRFVEKYYQNSEIKQSSPAIVLELNHIKFELVPAVYKGLLIEQLYIPAKANAYEEWISTDPNDFNKKLTEKNTDNNFNIKPLIRLVKYWNTKNGRIFDSYGLEKHIIDFAFEDIWFNKPTNLKDYFFKYMLGLSTSFNYPQSTNEKIEKAHKFIKNVKEYEQSGSYILAEAEIKKLIPEVTVKVSSRRTLLGQTQY